MSALLIAFRLYQMRYLGAFCVIVLGPKRPKICEVIQGDHFFFCVCDCNRANVVNVPFASVIPSHTFGKLLFNVRLKECPIATKDRSSAMPLGEPAPTDCVRNQSTDSPLNAIHRVSQPPIP